MNFWALLFGVRQESKAAQLAEIMAARSVPGALQQLSSQIHTMSLHEARGYIRARAGAVVRREVAAARQDNSLAGVVASVGDFTELVMQSVVRRVQQELHRRRMQTVPVRRAA